MAKKKNKSKQKKKVTPHERTKMIKGLFKKPNKREIRPDKLDGTDNTKPTQSKAKPKFTKRKKSDGNFVKDRIAELDKKLVEIRPKIYQKS